MLVRLIVVLFQNGMFRGTDSVTTTLTRFPGALHVPELQVAQVVVAGDPELDAVSHVVVAVSALENGYGRFWT